MKLNLDEIKEKFKNKKIILLLLLLFIGGGTTSVVVVTKNRAAINRASVAASKGDYSKTFGRSSSDDQNDAETMPYELAARSGFKRQNGAMGGSVPYDPSGDPSGYGEDGQGDGSNPANFIGGRTGVASLGVGVDGYGTGASGAGAGGAQQGQQGSGVGGGSGAFGIPKGSGGSGASAGGVGYNYEGEDLSSGEQMNAGDSIKSGTQMKSGQSSMNNKIRATQGTKGKMGSAASRGSRGRAAISKGSTGSDALGDLKQRTNIAYQSGSFDNEEQAAGAQDTVYWGGRASEDTTPGGGSAQGGAGNVGVNMTASGLISPSDMDSSGYANSDLSESNQQDALGWSISWKPKLFGGDTEDNATNTTCNSEGECESTWAKNEIKELWRTWDTSSYGETKGYLESIRREVLSTKGLWDASYESLFDSIIGTILGEICTSFYSDIDLILVHPTYAPDGVTIENCASSWGVPPPYVLSYCAANLPDFIDNGKIKARQGFETSFPTGFDSRNTWTSPGVLPSGTSAPASKIKWDNTQNTYLYDGTPYDPIVESFGSSQMAVAIENVGQGVLKLTYGICVACDSQSHSSFWPSVYVNIFRNFDGSSDSGGNYKRCLPASSPLSAPLIRCSQLASCEFRNKCGIEEIVSLKDDASFKSMMSQYPNYASEQVCDYYYGINATSPSGGGGKVESCVANGGTWPGTEPEDCDVE